MVRSFTALALLAGLSLLSGCVNSWQSGYVASSSLAAPAPSPGPIELRGMPAEDVLKAPPPQGCERIGYSEFVSSAGPELDRLQEFGQKLGATTIYWGRTFAQLSQETDYRADYYPSTSTTTITSPDGSKTTVHTNDGGTQYVPHVRTDAWYRYVAAFYRKAP